MKFKYLSKMAADEQLDEYVLNGQSLLDLPSDNATYLSVKAIKKARRQQPYRECAWRFPEIWNELNG